MIELSIGLDGVVSEKKINIGNKYENNDEVINFTLPSEFDNYHKYIIAVIKQDDTKITRVLPVTNNQFSVSTSITYMFFPISFNPPKLNIFILLIKYSFLLINFFLGLNNYNKKSRESLPF